MDNPQERAELARLRDLWKASDVQDYLKELMSEEGGEGVVGGNYKSWITVSGLKLIRIYRETAYFLIDILKSGNRFYAEWIVSKFGYCLFRSLQYVCKNSYVKITSFIINTPEEQKYRDCRAVAYGKVVYDPMERPPLPMDACKIISPTGLPDMRSIGDLTSNLYMP